MLSIYLTLIDEPSDKEKFLLLYHTYLDQENPYLNLPAEELNNLFEEIYAWEAEHVVYEVYSLDIGTGEVLPSDIPEKFDARSNMFARDGYFVYSDDTGMYAKDYNGNETSFPGEKIDKMSAKIVNGVFIQFTSKKAYNLSTGEVFDIKFPDGLTDYEINDSGRRIDASLKTMYDSIR